MSISIIPDPKTAIIQPLVVEILAIKIGNKQMTQSIFKQLQVRDLVSITDGDSIDSKTYLDGDVWGWVNHSVDGYSRYVVYTKSGILYKAPLNERENIPRLCKGLEETAAGKKRLLRDVGLDITSLVSLYIFNALIGGWDKNLLSIGTKEVNCFKSPFFTSSRSHDNSDCLVYPDKTNTNYQGEVVGRTICYWDFIEIGAGLKPESTYSKNIFVEGEKGWSHHHDNFRKTLRHFSIDCNLTKPEIANILGLKIRELIDERSRLESAVEDWSRLIANIKESGKQLQAEIQDKPQLFIAV